MESDLTQGFGDLPDNFPRFVAVRFGCMAISEFLMDIRQAGIGEPKLEVRSYSPSAGAGFS